MSQPHSRLEQLDPPVRGVILDGDGVLWKDSQPIGDLPSAFAAMRSRGLRISVATNNAMHTVEEYLRKFQGFGVELEAEQIVTAGEATAETLAAAFPARGAIYLVGELGVKLALEQQGFEVISDPEQAAAYLAVVAGIDHELSYARLQKASSLIRAGLPFYGTNPDPTFPTPAGLVPGAGAMIAAIATASGRQPIMIGKPSPLLFQTAAQRLQLAAAELLVIGDRLETDIQGGQAFGARTALVLSGASSQAEADAWKPSPTIVAPSLSALLGL